MSMICALLCCIASVIFAVLVMFDALQRYRHPLDTVMMTIGILVWMAISVTGIVGTVQALL